LDAELAGGPDLTLWMVLIAIPLVLVLATAFTKSTVVLGALRVGLGAEAILPLPVVFAVALVVTAVVMAPVALETLQVIEAVGGIEAMQAGGLGIAAAIFEPLRAFVQVHAAPDEVQFFAQLQGRAATDPLVLVPAFLVTELAEAMAMAVVIIVPLVLVDLLTAQVLVLWGLVNQPTAVVTVPLKLLLFLAVGGWDVVIGGLVEGYA
jgi:flagellar biosynthesis protein FliP